MIPFLIGSYAVVVLALAVGLWRLPRSVPLGDADCPSVSVVITARNEERDLPRCLAAIAGLDYPADRLQVVLVDDRSTDGTGSLIDAFAARQARTVALHTAALPDNGLEAKARGIAHGIAHATGEWVLITDADSAVRPAWIRYMLSGVDSHTGLVGGAVAVEPVGLVGVIERAAWGFVQIFSAGAAGLGMPFICVGPNMGIRRSTYVAAGGLERASFRVAEDLALTQMVARAGQRVRVTLDAESTVTMTPVPTLAHLVSQQRRWMGGGFEQGWGLRVALFALFGWGFLLAAWFASAWWYAPQAWGMAIAIRAVVDGLALATLGRRMEAGPMLRYLPVAEAYTVLIFLFLPPSLFARPRVAWRGDGYAVRYGNRGRG